jgi:hypothetical protein
MNPCISLFPNAQFYEKKILDGPNVLCPSYSKDYTCLPFGTYTFINVSDGREDKEGTGNSRRNMVEVAVVLHLIHTIFKCMSTLNSVLFLNILSTFFMKLYGYYNMGLLEADMVFLPFTAYCINFIGRNVFTTSANILVCIFLELGSVIKKMGCTRN